MGECKVNIDTQQYREGQCYCKAGITWQFLISRGAGNNTNVGAIAMGVMEGWPGRDWRERN